VVGEGKRVLNAKYANQGIIGPVKERKDGVSTIGGGSVWRRVSQSERVDRQMLDATRWSVFCAFPISAN
jgi:hypothetical protein